MIRKFFASMFVVLFLVMSILSVFLLSLKITFLNPDFYKEDLVEKVYETGVFVAGRELSDPEKSPLGKYYSADEISDRFRELLPLEIFEEQVSEFVGQIVDWDFGKTGKKTLSVSFVDIKSHVPEVVPKLIDDLFERVPICEVAPAEGAIPDCIPPGFTKDQLNSQLGAMLYGEFLDRIPDNYELELPEPSSDMQEFLNIFLPVIKNLQWILAFILLFLAGIVALILWRPVSRTLKWEGSMFLTAGIEVLVLSLAFKFGPGNIPYEKFQELGISEEQFSDVIDVASMFLNIFGEAMLIFSIIYIIIGGILLVSYFSLKNR